MLDDTIIEKISKICNRIQSIIEEITVTIENIDNSISKPFIGVFRKSHYDYREDLRSSFNHLGKRLK